MSRVARVSLKALVLLVAGCCLAWRAEGAPAAEFFADGVKVIVQPRPGSQTVAAAIYFRGGRGNLTPETAGLENLLVASAIEGTQKFPRDVLRAETARLAAILDYHVGNDFSFIGFRSTTESFARSFAILADAALHPALESDDVERVRTRLIAVAASEGDTDLVRQRRVEEALYRGHPYAPPAEGTPASLRSFRVDGLKAHHRRLVAQSRLLVVVAGGVGVEEVRAAIGSLFAGLPVGSAPPAVPALQIASATKVHALDLAVPRAEISFAGPSADSSDIPALQAMTAVLKNRLFEVVRERAALSYDPVALFVVNGASHGAIQFSSTEPDGVARLAAAEFDRLRKEPASQTLSAAIVTQLRATELSESQTNDAQVQRLALYEILRGGWRKSLESSFDAVTPAQIQAAAQKYLQNFQYVVLTPRGQVIDERIFSR